MFFKAFTLSIPVGVHECNMRLGEQKIKLPNRLKESKHIKIKIHREINERDGQLKKKYWPRQGRKSRRIALGVKA